MKAGVDVTRIFAEFDTNGDSEITRDELHEGLLRHLSGVGWSEEDLSLAVLALDTSTLIFF